MIIRLIEVIVLNLIIHLIVKNQIKDDLLCFAFNGEKLMVETVQKEGKFCPMYDILYCKNCHSPMQFLRSGPIAIKNNVLKAPIKMLCL